MLYNVYVVDLCSDKRPATGGKDVKNYSSHRFAKLTLARACMHAWACVQGEGHRGAGGGAAGDGA